MDHESTYQAIAHELIIQEQLRRAGKFYYTAASPGITHDACLAILTEEVGEVARTINDRTAHQPVEFYEHLKAELIQVAAVAVAWIEKIDREFPPERAHS